MTNLIIAKSTAGVWSFQKSSNGTLADGTKYTGPKITIGSEKGEFILNNDGSKMYFKGTNVYYNDTNYASVEEVLDALATDGLAVNFNSGGVSPQLMVYSETETVVGTWIDGKPIYRKVLDIINHEMDSDLNHDLGISKYIRIDIFNTTNLFKLDSKNVIGGKGYTVLDPDFIGELNGGTVDPFDGYAILEYTKLTD